MNQGLTWDATALCPPSQQSMTQSAGHSATDSLSDGQKMNTLPYPDKVPDAVEPATGLNILTDEEVDKVAEEAGLIQLKGKHLNSLRKLGEHISLSGVVHIGLAKVLATEEKINELRGKCEKVIDSSEDNKDKLDAIRAATSIDTLKLRAAELMVKMVEAKLIPTEGGKPKSPAFAIGEVVVPVQVNVTNRTDSAGDKTAVS